MTLTREAIEIDGSKQLEEARTVLREFSKVLVYHVERGFEYSVEDSRNLGCEERLKSTKQLSDRPLMMCIEISLHQGGQ